MKARLLFVFFFSLVVATPDAMVNSSLRSLETHQNTEATNSHTTLGVEHLTLKTAHEDLERDHVLLEADHTDLQRAHNRLTGGHIPTVLADPRGEGKAILVTSQFSHNLSVSL